MHHVQLTESVRRQVAETFSELGAPPCEEFRESLLIRDGAYCGRRFQADDGHAIWFVEENQVKFYRADGSVACVIEPKMTIETRQARMAA
jgi:hypothetical protein